MFALVFFLYSIRLSKRVSVGLDTPLSLVRCTYSFGDTYLFCMMTTRSFPGAVITTTRSFAKDQVLVVSQGR